MQVLIQRFLMQMKGVCFGSWQDSVFSCYDRCSVELKWCSQKNVVIGIQIAQVIDPWSESTGSKRGKDFLCLVFKEKIDICLFMLPKRFNGNLCYNFV